MDNSGFDLVTNAGPYIRNRSYPRGLDVEVFSFDVLKKAFENATLKHQREHVTPYIYEKSERFRVHYVKAEGKLKRPDIRITLDTKEDFELIKKIILHFDNIEFTARDIVDFLNRNPKLLEINKNIEQKNIFD